nr:hypothetical protein BaRGS_027323 [Batillaria attramentaria]
MFQKLPSISPLFVCNFTTSVTSLFPFDGTDSVPPLSLLEHVTTWVTSDCTLCCESVRQKAIHKTCSSPIPGLLTWCVLGPIVCTHLLNTPASASAKSASKKTNSNNSMCKASQSRTLATLSKLHLGVLQSLDFCRGSPLSQSLMSVTDAMCLVKQLSGLLDHVKEMKLQVGAGEGVSVAEDEVVHTSLERMAQVLHVAKMAGSLKAQLGQLPELAKLTKKFLPDNRLLGMVLAQ